MVLRIFHCCRNKDRNKNKLTMLPLPLQTNRDLAFPCIKATNQLSQNAISDNAVNFHYAFVGWCGVSTICLLTSGNHGLVLPCSYCYRRLDWTSSLSNLESPWHDCSHVVLCSKDSLVPGRPVRRALHDCASNDWNDEASLGVTVNEPMIRS